MISSSTRASRSASRSASRYSSPAQPNGGNVGKPLEVSKSSANEGSRSFMQRWLEPSVQAKPSFEEAGLMRGGVVENMAPLGALPKAKKATGENGAPTRKIILKHSGANLAKKLTAGETPGKDIGDEVAPISPAVSPPASPLFPPAPTNKRKSLAAKLKDDEADDEEYDPKGVSRGRRRSGRVSLPAKRTTAATAMAELPSPRERRRSTSIVLKPVTPVKRQARSEPEQQGFTDRVVAAAVDEALKHYRYPTAWALKTLYEEKGGDADFVAMIEDVFSQTADEETLQDFFKQMEERKREGKKDNRGCYFFVPPSTNSRFTPHKPIAAPYGDLIHEPEELPQEETTTRAAKKAKTSHGGDGVATLSATPRRKGAVSASAGKKDKENDKHKQKTQTTTGIIKVKTPGSRKRGRRDSGSSDSSLSTAISMSSPEVRVSSMNSPSAFRGGATGRGGGGGGRRAQQGQQGHGGGGGGGGQGDNDLDMLRTTGTTGTTTKSTGAKSQTAPKSQPITTRGKSVASSKHAVSNSSRSNSPTLHNTSRTRAHKSSSHLVDDASMPGRVSAAELFPNLNVKSAEKSFSATHDAEKDLPPHMPEEDEDSFWDRRRTARGVTNSFDAKESSIRGPDAERETTPVKKTRRTRQSLAASVTTRATRSASKRPNDDVERTVSPIAFSLPGDGSSTVGSRAATPTSLRPAKKQKTGLRVKSS